MTGVGISDTIGNRMLNGPSIADTSRGAVALEVSAPMATLVVPARVAVIPLIRRGGAIAGHAIVDAADADDVGRWAWYLNSNGYARHRNPHRSRPKYLYLHRYLMGMGLGDGLFVDHINRDKLDNRRSNLRIVTPAQSRQNTPSIVGPFRGVTFSRSRGLWQATVQIDGRGHTIGRYATAEEAAEKSRAYRLLHMPFTVEDVP